MPRKLKTFVTSLGFFDQAIAAPSMKAALEAFGSSHNLFHQGFAKETDDPAIVAATMEHPGIVLKRPVGSKGLFRENAELPTSLPAQRLKGSPFKAAKPKESSPPKKRKHPPSKQDAAAAQKAAEAYERGEKLREKRRQKEEAIRAKATERREAAVAKAQDMLDRSRNEHEERMEALESERASLDKKIQAEESRWAKELERLQDAIDGAKEQ